MMMKEVVLEAEIVLTPSPNTEWNSVRLEVGTLNNTPVGWIDFIRRPSDGEEVLEFSCLQDVGRVLTPWNITPSHNTISIILKITKWWIKVYQEQEGNQQSLVADQQCPRETWLNSEVEPTFGKICGYTHWTRKDRLERAGGGVAVCFKEGLQSQLLDVVTPPEMEAMFFRVVLADRSALLICAMYRPPRQGPASLDDLLILHRCSHVLVVGDLNHHLEQQAYENLLDVQGLIDHVTFPTHEQGGTLDPVISDLQEDTLCCHQLGPVGSSDHHAVLTKVNVGVARDEATTRTIWMWDKADWLSLRRDLQQTPWTTLLQGGSESMARAFTSHLLALQNRHVPHRSYTTRPKDQPWFGYRCRAAAEEKWE
ncbi:hypothetical protein Pmani_001267 [Petrolisthes manimaculis]|uniref:Endonuclease/exonuclease/phosphatase domain-containing protein n=1 Tax=Petrolisthes manimaculis TaxID=1843537 RepID=A0AAE1US68_9EUCA|nr:hypothetical protein Pmani_001267 [Petrolisthes manimaculis]